MIFMPYKSLLQISGESNIILTVFELEDVDVEHSGGL